MKYVLFRCGECNSLVAYPAHKPDGHTCRICKGFLFPLAEGSRADLIRKYGITFLK